MIVCLPVVSVFAEDTGEEAVLQLSLSDAVVIALDRNYSLKNVGYDVSLSESNLRISENQFAPKLELNTDHALTIMRDADASDDEDLRSMDHEAGLNVSKNFVTGATVDLFSTINRYDILDGPESGDATDYTHSFGITVQQPLLKDAGIAVNRAELKKAELSLENARYSYGQESRRLVRDVVSAYFRALKRQKLVQAIESGVNEAATHLHNAQIKLQEGLVAQIHVSQAELQWEQKKNSLVSARQSALDAVEYLKLLTGLDLDIRVELTEEVAVNRYEGVDEGAAIAEALTNRVEIRELDNQLKSSELSVITARNGRMPDVDFLVQTSVINYEDNFSDAFRTDSPEYQTALGFSYAFGERSDNEAYFQSKLSRLKLKNQVQDQERTIIREVKSALRYYLTLQESIKLSRRSLDLSRESLNLVNKSYEEGLIGYLELLRAQDDLVNAETNYYSNLMDFQSAKADLLYVLGRDIEPENLKRPVRFDGREEAGETYTGEQR